MARNETFTGQTNFSRQNLLTTHQHCNYTIRHCSILYTLQNMIYYI